MVKEVWFHYFPESDKGVRAKTKDGVVICSLKTQIVFANNSAFIQVFSVDTATVGEGVPVDDKLVYSREVYDVDPTTPQRFPSEKTLDKIFGGRTRTVANSYPVSSKIIQMTVDEFYEFVADNIGEYS